MGARDSEDLPASCLIWPNTRPFSRPLRSNPAAFDPILKPEALNEVTLAKAISLASEARWSAGETIGLPDGYRQCRSTYLKPDQESAALFSTVWQLLDDAAQQFAFDIAGLAEPLMLVEYRAGDQFDWHSDCGPSWTANRKISLSIQLSDAVEYAGGDLEFHQPFEASRQRTLGTAILFPAFLPHRVSPVESGVRRSLVAWAYGPTFR